MARPPRPLIGLAAGIAAGIVAAAAMAAFEAQAARLLPEGEDDDEHEPGATPYIVGAVMGGIYGVLSEYRPEASAGFGGAYGVATAALIDPAAALVGAEPMEEIAVEPPLGTASHLVFGLVLEGVRWLIAGRR